MLDITTTIVIVVMILMDYCVCIELILFDNWSAAYNICQSAVNDAKSKGQCTNKLVTIDHQKGCFGDNSVKASSYAINKVAAKTSNDYDFAFIGPTCPYDLQTIGDFAKLWKSPVVGYESTFQSESVSHSSIINVAQFSIAGAAQSLAQLLKELNETDITLLGSVRKMPNGISLCNDLREYNRLANYFNIKSYMEIDENHVDFSEVDTLVRHGPRTLVVCADFYDIYTSLYNIGIRIYGGFRFYIIVIVSRPPKESLSQSNMKNLLYGSNSFIIAPVQSVVEDATSLMHEIVPNLTIIQEEFTTFLRIYHACYSYCVGSVNGVETQTDNYQAAMGGRVVENKYGNFTFDESGSVLTNYAVYSMNPSAMSFDPLMILTSIPKSCDAHNCFQLAAEKRADLQWSLRDLPPPADCVAENSCTNYIPQIGAAVIVGVFIVAGILLFLKQRRKRLNVYKLTWKVPKDSMKIITGRNKNKDDKTRKELENEMKDYGKNNAADRDAVQDAIKLITKRRTFDSFALVGNQRAEFVAFRQNKKIKFTEETLDYLYKLKQLQNDNLAKFFGIQVNDNDRLTVLHVLVERGTLEEFCLDDDFNMNDTFKSAFMRDIIKGLQYLHKSPVGYHGFLMAATCLIDINWVLKMTLYGVSNFLAENCENDNIEPDSKFPPLSFQQFLCFPPEYIRDYDPTGPLGPRNVRGSATGDIYNLAMIFFMMVENAAPYDKDSHMKRCLLIEYADAIVQFLAALLKEIIDDNKMPSGNPFSEGEQNLIKFCEMCWHRDPEKRPNLKEMLKAVDSTYPGSSGNLVDQMIRMNEKNAANLEKLVAERTAELAVAEEQTMRLLNEMLPASVAKDLKNGIILPPRSYASATVMFVQICDFSTIMKRSLPNQVIYFLNDIFDQFDTVIKNHDAYKVETTGETYMVASGVPHENGGNHVFEVAEMSLEIRDISYIYSQKHNKNYRIRIRIGFHAGPIAAGVIGIRSPRYCLFGDTVNFASRMQSNCPPNQIQTSEITAKLLTESHQYKLVKRGIVHVKGKGEVNCYWLNEHIHDDSHQPPAAGPLVTSSAPFADPLGAASV